MLRHWFSDYNGCVLDGRMQGWTFSRSSGGQPLSGCSLWRCGCGPERSTNSWGSSILSARASCCGGCSTRTGSPARFLRAPGHGQDHARPHHRPAYPGGVRGAERGRRRGQRGARSHCAGQGTARVGSGQRTVLFLDEIHRFSRAQQDVLLGDVENGLIILIGATTENPFFSVNSPLICRSQIFQFEPLSLEAIQTL